MSSSYDAPRHDESILFYTVRPDIIILGFGLAGPRSMSVPWQQEENLSLFRAVRCDIVQDVPPVTRTRLRVINSAQLTGVTCGSHVHIREFRNFNSLKASFQASFWPSCFACALVRPALRLGCPWRTTTLVTNDASRGGHDRSPLLCRIGLDWTWTGLTAAV